jgi:hypothetical protein
MTATLIYYYILFVFIFIIRLFKLLRDSDKHKIYEYFYIGQEIVYTSAGVLIMILEKDRNYLAPIAIGYVILVFISSAIDSLDQIKRKGVIASFNILIITIIFIGTGVTYISYLPSIDNETKQHNNQSSDTIKSFTVVIPYSDNSLKRNIGKDKFGERQLFYSIELKCDDERKAIDSAKNVFNELQISKAIYPDIKGVDNKIVQNDNKIIVKKDFKVVKKEL